MRIGKLGAVGGLVALSAAGVAAPPARSAGASTVVVEGTVALSGTMNPACTVGGSCSPSVVLTPPPTGKQAPPYTVVGALRTVSFSSSSCTGAGLGTCMAAASGSIHGYCDLASGRWSVGVNDAAGTTHILDLTYELIGRTFVGRGHTTRPGDPEVGDTFVTGVVTGGCAAGTTSLSVTLSVAVVYPKLTL